MQRVFVLFFFLATFAFSSTTTNVSVTPRLIETLKEKLNSGQVSVEPGPGEGSATLAEQIQFLEGELLKTEQSQSIVAPQQQVLSPVLIPPALPQPPQQQTVWPTPVSSTMASQSPITPQEFEALKARTTALEARLAALESQRPAASLMPQGAIHGG